MVGPGETKAKAKWWESPWLKIGLSLTLLAILFLNTDTSELAGVVAGAHVGWLFAAFVGWVVSQIISAYRWMMLAHPPWIRRRLRPLFRSLFLRALHESLCA